MQEQPVEDSAVRAGPVRRVEGPHPLLQQVLKDSTRRLPAQETGAHHRRRQPGLGTPHWTASLWNNCRFYDPKNFASNNLLQKLSN